MAASPITVFDVALPRFFNGQFRFGANASPPDTFFAVLLGAAQVLDATFVGASGGARYSDFTDEIAAGGGYTTGGEQIDNLVVSLTGSGATAMAHVDADDTTWAALTASGIAYVAIYEGTGPEQYAVGFFVPNEDLSPPLVNVSGGPFTIQWNADGILTLERTP